MNQRLKDEYMNQLRNGCGDICSRIFCGGGSGDCSVELLSEIFSRYGDTFLCRNICRTIEQTSDQNLCTNGNDILDFFFHLTMKVLDSEGISTKPHGETAYIDEGSVLGSKNIIESVEWMNKKMRKDLMVDSKNTVEDGFWSMRIGERNGIEELNHQMCGTIFMNPGLSVEDRYIVIGVLQLLLRRYEYLPHLTLGMVIVRIYCLIKGYEDLDDSYYVILHKIFNHIHYLHVELKTPSLGEGIPCEGRRTSRKVFPCIYFSGLTRSDLTLLVDGVAHALNTSQSVDTRENKRVNNLLSIFHLLYLINEDCGLLSYKRFYLKGFCSKMNFREEFRHFRSKSKTPISFSFILPVHVKAELIKYENNDKMKTSLQDSFFKSLFEGHVDPYLFITVDRDTVYRDSIDIFKGLGMEDVRKQLRITFKNEEGVDSGGIRKEYFQLLSQEIREDRRLFDNMENRIWIKPDGGDENDYESIGKIIGIALYNNVVLNIPFPRLFFKKLLDKKSSIDDLREISSGITTSLRNLKKLSKDELDSLNLNFIVEYNTDGVTKTYPLVKNGENIRLNASNLKLFIEKYSEFYTDGLIQSQFDAIRRGFYSVIDRNTLIYLDPKELEKIMMGSNAFDIRAIKSTTTYSGFNEDSPIITHFWEVFEGFDKRKKRRLLQFITGNDRIPVSGSASLRLVIMKNGCDTDRLPSSQTCFNTLLLPEYSSRDKLERKLETALELTAGFFLL